MVSFFAQRYNVLEDLDGTLTGAGAASYMLPYMNTMDPAYCTKSVAASKPGELEGAVCKV